MSKKITITVELEEIINDRAFCVDDFVEDLIWAVKEYVDDRLEGFSDWNEFAIKGKTNQEDFKWSNSVVDALVRTRNGVSHEVEDVEYAEVEEEWSK